MNDRLLALIKYKTGGRQKAFAELLGWTPQYLAKLLRGENFGLSPVLTLVEALPEVDARWLLTGEGDMLCAEKVDALRRDVVSHVSRVLDLERFMVVMSPEELHRFEDCILRGAAPSFSDADVARWESLLADRNAKIDEAILKSSAPCRPPKASK